MGEPTLREPLEEAAPGEVFGDGPDEQDQEPQAGAGNMTAAKAAVRQFVLQSHDVGTGIAGPGGLLKQITKAVIESALDEEMSERLGHDKNAPQGRNVATPRNGNRSKAVSTGSVGDVRIEVPSIGMPRSSRS